MEPRKNRNSVFKICYHVIWCCKHRKPILKGQTAEDVKELLLKIASDNGFNIEKAEIMPDCIRLIITASPNHLIADMVKALKGVSARFLFKKHPELKDQLYGGHLWNPSYYVETVGNVSEETAANYIESQKK